MIVNAVPEGWEIIYQQAHGILAAQLAYYLKPELQCAYWVETLVAVANHDNRQKDWRGRDGLTAAGAPADFTLLPVTLEQAKALMQEVRFQSQWTAMLTSMHMSYLYESQRTKSKNIASFLDEQLELQKACRQGLHISKKEAQSAYAIMQWCDRLSLILCRNELPTDERQLEITAGPTGKIYFVQQLQNDTITIKPWPFSSSQLEVQVEYRVLTQLQYTHDDALAEALHAAKVNLKIWALTN